MRIRTIKPEFFEDEKLAELPPHDRLMFIGLWLLADRNGVLEHRPTWIKAKVFPYEVGEAVDASRVLPRLIRGKFVIPYSVDGKDYLWLPGFAKHQRVSGKEAQSDGRYPMPQGDLDELLEAYEDEGSNGEATGKHKDGPITGNREQGTGNREQGTGNREQESLAPQDSSLARQNKKDWAEIDAQFEDWYNRYDRKKARPKALAAWRKLKPEERVACLGVVDAFVRSTPDPRYRPHPTTYLNARRWEDDIDQPPGQDQDEGRELTIDEFRQMMYEKLMDMWELDDEETRQGYIDRCGSKEAACEWMAQQAVDIRLAREARGGKENAG